MKYNSDIRSGSAIIYEAENLNVVWSRDVEDYKNHASMVTACKNALKDLNKKAELQRQYDLFCEWYLSAFPDGDETLVASKYLDGKFNLGSPVTEVSAMWLGWRNGLGL